MIETSRNILREIGWKYVETGAIAEVPRTK